jgi:hypothetical protein
LLLVRAQPLACSACYVVEGAMLRGSYHVNMIAGRRILACITLRTAFSRTWTRVARTCTHAPRMAWCRHAHGVARAWHARGTRSKNTPYVPSLDHAFPRISTYFHVCGTYVCKELAVLEKAACKAGTAGKTLPSCLPQCATQCCLAATRMHSWPTHCNAPLTVNAEQVEHSCQDPGASGAPTLLRPGSIKQRAAHARTSIS